MARSRHPLADDILTESGVMGVYDTTLSLADAEILGRAFATFLIRRGGGCVAVCFDSRPSSPDLATALMSGLTRAGAEVLRLGSGPLPMLHFGANRLGADAAVMVTGADAPMEYNGVRLFRKGRRICPQEMLAVANCATLGDFESGGGVQRDTPIASSYVEDLARLSTDRMSLLTVLWDAGFGLGGPLLQALSRQLKGRHLVQNESPGRNFADALDRRRTESRLDQLSAAIQDGGCTLGIAFDATGERMIAMDRAGHMLPYVPGGTAVGSGRSPVSADPFRLSVALCANYTGTVRNNHT